MKNRNWPKRDPIKHYFPLPNEIFSLGLTIGEIAIYGYLLSIENRKTYQCWPSYKTIAKAVGVSANTVGKYVQKLVERELITTEPTKVRLQDGTVRNGSLLYNILPIQLAINRFHERQLCLADMERERQRVTKILQEQDQPAPCEPT